MSTSITIPRISVVALLSTLLFIVPASLWAAHPRAAHNAPTVDPLGGLPTAFVPNVGQVDPEVRFHARGLQGQAFFTPSTVVLTLPADVLTVRFLDASSDTAIEAGRRLPGTFNRFAGNDPRTWQRNVPNHAEIHYRELWRGVDLHYEGRDGTLKGTYTVAPGVDVATLRWHYDGASTVRLDNGDLVVSLPSGATVTEHAPIAWQIIDGKKVDVTCEFSLHHGDAGGGVEDGVGFRVGAYRHDLPLIIDPTLVYSTYVGGSDQDEGWSLAVDREGAIYVTGQTKSFDFPTLGAHQPHKSADFDSFVFKLDPASNQLVFSTYFGGDDWDIGMGIATDDGGYVYVTGQTWSSNFPVTGHLQPSSLGLSDAFVARFDGGGGLDWSSYLGGSDSDLGSAVGFDPSSGSVVVTGATTSHDFPVVQPFQASQASWHWDAFVTWIDVGGGGIHRSTFFGGSAHDVAHDLAVAVNGDVIIGGYTQSFDLPVANAAYPSYGGDRDGFVTRFDINGLPLFSTYLGGSDFDSVEGVAVDEVTSDAVATGITRSVDFPLAGTPAQATPPGNGDAFATRLPVGGPAVYSTYLGGSDYDFGTAAGFDGYGNVFLVGQTHSIDFPLVDPIQSTIASQDGYVTVLDPTGAQILFSTYFGGSDPDYLYDLVVRDDDAYVTGFTSSIDLPLAQPWQSMLHGSYDALVAILDTGVSDCRIVGSPADIPSPTVLDFDSLVPTQIVGTTYLASHGITFVDNTITKVRVYNGMPSLAASSPNVVYNNATPGHHSGHVPLHIDFTQGKTHVGMWIGNGGGFAPPTAVVRAFDANLMPICESVHPNLPDPHTTWVGFHDPAGRIRTIEIDYGSSWLSESLDDLTFAP